MPVWATILLALATLCGGSAGTVAVQAYLQRGREPGLIAKITAEAHTQIYDSYGDLLGELRKDAAVAREEGRGAREVAQSAELRAKQAEARAAGAEARAATAEAQLVQVVSLFRQVVPNADELLRPFDQLNALSIPLGDPP